MIDHPNPLVRLAAALIITTPGPALLWAMIRHTEKGRK
jgi:hypothetical protein